MARTFFLKNIIRTLSTQVKFSSRVKNKSQFSDSRRSFLKLGFATGVTVIGSSLIQACTSNSINLTGLGNDLGRKKIAIVGGGLAGLAAAYQLKKAGLDTTIFEASSRLGGRILTIYDQFGTNTYSENGGEFVDSNHSFIRQLCKEFSIPLLDLERNSRDNHLSPQDYYIDGIKYSEQDVVAAFGQASKTISIDLEACGDFTTPKAIELDNTSLSSYVLSLPMPVWLSALLINAYEAEFGIEASRQSSLNLIDMIGTDVSSGFKVFGESDERYKIKGGSSALISALRDELADRIRFNKQLSELSSNGPGAQLGFSDGTTFGADYLILCIPFTVLRSIKIGVSTFSPEKLKCIKELGYGNNCKVIMATSSRPWREDKSAGYLINEEIQNGWDATQMQSENAGPGAYTVFLGGRKANAINSEFHASKFHLERFKNVLTSVYPSMEGAFTEQARTVNWVSNKYALGSYPAYKVGQWTTIAGQEAVPADYIFFAGDHTSDEFQGYMNGAAESGARAANEVVSKLRIKT